MSHVYQVRNACSGNLVFTSGSGTTATVEPASSATVICDGTNCYRFTDAADVATCLAAAKAYTDAAAFDSASGNLPGQPGNAGKYLQTNGTIPTWVAIASSDVTGALGVHAPGRVGYTPLNAAANLADVASPSASLSALGGVSSSFLSANYSTTTLIAATYVPLSTIGTSGATIPLLNGANTWSGLQTNWTSANLTPAATPATNAVGYLGIPQTTRSDSYGPVMADSGCEQFFTSTATATIPANSSVAYPIGTILVLSVDSGHTLTVAITTDTLTWKFLPARRVRAHRHRPRLSGRPEEEGDHLVGDRGQHRMSGALTAMLGSALRVTPVADICSSGTAATETIPAGASQVVIEVGAAGGGGGLRTSPHRGPAQALAAMS